VTYLGVKKTIIEKRWGIIAILLGITVGFVSALACIIWHLVIFGFNIMYIISPLMAGVVETVIARRKYGKSTGAISALVTFLLINIYGWFLPGSFVDPTKEPATLSLITIIAILLTLQAAFPTFMNYLLFVVGVSIIRKIIGALIYLPLRIRGEPRETVKYEIRGPSADESFLNELTIPLVSVPNTAKGKIKKNIGLVTGEAIAEEKETEGLVNKLTNVLEPTLLEDVNLGEARKEAMSRMLEKAKLMGANNVVEVMIDYVSMGGLQGSVLIVSATGTAVLCE
jgi:uncharacterized protein YbjQ (UPF0145 family)